MSLDKVVDVQTELYGPSGKLRELVSKSKLLPQSFKDDIRTALTGTDANDNKTFYMMSELKDCLYEATCKRTPELFSHKCYFSVKLYSFKIPV